jgi:hypothetical protein
MTREVWQMKEIEIETTIEVLRRLCARLETLRRLDSSEIVLLNQHKQYEQTLDDAYAAFAQLETKVDELGQELEYQHQRLGEVVELDTGER